MYIYIYIYIYTLKHHYKEIVKSISHTRKNDGKKYIKIYKALTLAS